MNLPMQPFLMLTCVLCASVTARAASITNVGLLPGGEYTEVHGLSGDGSVAVGSGDSSSVGGAFRWTATSGTLQNLGVLPGDLESYATAVSDDGSVVVGRSFVIGSGTSSAYRWTATSGTMENLVTLPGATWSEARAVSSTGSTVVGMSYDSGNNDMAVRWASGTVQSLGRFPGGTRSWAEGVSDDGSVVVGSANDAANTYRAYRWTTASNTLQDLGTLPGGSAATQTLAEGVNGDGSVVVGGQGIGNDLRAFRWTLASGTMQDLGLLPDGAWARAFAVSADGETIVGEAGDAVGDTHAFFYTPTLGMQDLNTYLPSLGVDLTDWVLESAYTVSADGNWIGGIGVYQDTSSGFVVNITPVPEPSIWAMAVAGLACGGWSVRRRRCGRALRVLVACSAWWALLAAVPAPAATFTWGNMTPNGSLSGTNGYSFTSAANWVGGAPIFDDQAELVFAGLNSGTSTTTWGGFATTTMNRITASTSSTLRFNSADSTFSFQGVTPTVDIQAGTVRMEVMVSSGTAGLTKTGDGVLFSNLQSASAGFTGPFTLAQGLLTSGNSFALGDQKTVNILSGAGANMSGQQWAASNMSGGGTVARQYTFNISGSGVGGLGAIYNSGGAVVGTFSGIHSVNLSADASVGGTGDFSIANFGSIAGNGFTLTKVGSNQIFIGSSATTNVPFHVAEGTLVGHVSDNALGDATGSVSVAGGARLASNNNRSFANSLTFADGATLTNFLNSATWSGNATLTSGTTTVTGSSASTPITMSGVISGSGGITKTGANLLTLSNANAYTGVTFISSGTVRLAATGSIDNSSTINVASGAIFDVSPVVGYMLAPQILTGAGTVIGDVTFSNGATVRPGDSPGTLTVTGDVVWNAGGNYDWEILNATGSVGTADGWDLLTVGGSLDLTNLSPSNRFNINLWSLSSAGPDVNGAALNFDRDVNGSWTILTAAGGISGFSSDLFQINVGPFNGTGGFANVLAANGFFSMQQVGGSLNLIYTVPEPAAIALALAGFACGRLALRRRKRP